MNKKLFFRVYFWPMLAMCIVVAVSNVLVNHRIYWFGLENIFTYGTFAYPFTFLINDLTSRRFGALVARRVVYMGFLTGLCISLTIAGPRVSLAMGGSFLLGQLCHIFIITTFRRSNMWQIPLIAAVISSGLDTFSFFWTAFSPSFAFVDSLAQMKDHSIYEWTNFFSLSIPVWLSLAMGDVTITLLHRMTQIAFHMIGRTIFTWFKTKDCRLCGWVIYRLKRAAR